MAKTRWTAVAPLVLLLLGASPLLPSCGMGKSQVETAAEDDQFMAWLQGVSKAAKTDPKYKELSIKTPAQIEAFMIRTHEAYRKKISIEEYSRWLNASYPGRAYEVDFITQRLPR
jgi:hypothetical protein